MTTRHDRGRKSGCERDDRSTALIPPHPIQYLLSGSVRMQTMPIDPAGVARFDSETATIEALTDEAAAALCDVIGASDTIDLTRKLFRLAAASTDAGHCCRLRKTSAESTAYEIGSRCGCMAGRVLIFWPHDWERAERDHGDRPARFCLE